MKFFFVFDRTWRTQFETINYLNMNRLASSHFFQAESHLFQAR